MVHADTLGSAGGVVRHSRLRTRHALGPPATDRSSAAMDVVDLTPETMECMRCHRGGADALLRVVH